MMRAAGSRQLPRIPVTIQTGKLLGFEHGALLDVHVTARLEIRASEICGHSARGRAG
jgi:hypothetical protein